MGPERGDQIQTQDSEVVTALALVPCMTGLGNSAMDNAIAVKFTYGAATSLFSIPLTF